MSPVSNPGKLSRSVFSWLIVIPLLSVLLLELVLQIGAFAVQLTGHKTDAQWQTGNLRIVTLGDSHTYGLYLTAEDAWPSQLEQFWNNKHPQQPIEIINLGFPGTNSSRIVANLPKVIDTFKPDIVMVLVGINNYWMAPVSTEAAKPLPPAIQWLQQHSRTWKLLYMLQKQQVNRELLEVDASAKAHRTVQYDDKAIEEFNRNVQQRTKVDMTDIDTAFHYGDEDFSLGSTFDSSPKDNPKLSLRQDLEKMVVLAKDRQVELMLVTYIANNKLFKMVNNQAKWIAKNHNIPITDMTDFVRQHCNGKLPCETYLFPDNHPTAAGQKAIADAVVTTLQEELAKPADKVR